MCVRTITFELSDVWPGCLARWFIFTLSGLISKVKVIGKKFTITLHEEDIAKVVGATSREGFLMDNKVRQMAIV